jgi:hypothetical protein
MARMEEYYYSYCTDNNYDDYDDDKSYSKVSSSLDQNKEENEAMIKKNEILRSSSRSEHA